MSEGDFVTRGKSPLSTRITGPDATLIAEVFENPDVAAVIAPLICEAVNAYFGIDASKTYQETP